LRFFAAFLVVIHHMSQVIWREYAGFPILHGQLGVDVFFVVSGFIIAYSARSCAKWSDFIRRRLFRVVPLYWAATLFLFVVAFFLPDFLNSTTANPWNLLKSLFFIPYVKENGYVQPVLFLGWTLNYEVFFYVVFALAMAAFKRPVIFVTIFFSFIVFYGYVFRPTSVIPWFYTSGIILEFVAGLWIYEFYHLRDFRPVKGAPILLVIGVAALVAQLGGGIALPREVMYGIPSALAVFGAISWTVPRTFFTRMAVALGDASYSMYILHSYIIYSFVKLFKYFIGVTPVAMAFTVVSITVVAMIASLACCKYFERPSNDWLTAVWQSRRRAFSLR
jgi:peptidoglycan/LPS O-acetylase OafA/YrhL